MPAFKKAREWLIRMEKYYKRSLRIMIITYPLNITVCLQTNNHFHHFQKHVQRNYMKIHRSFNIEIKCLPDYGPKNKFNGQLAKS